MSKNAKTRTGVIRPVELRGRLTTGQTGLGPVLVSAAPDQTVRWREGERLDQLFEDRCDRLLEQGHGGHLAVDADDIVLTYRSWIGARTSWPATCWGAVPDRGTASRCCSTSRRAPTSRCLPC